MARLCRATSGLTPSQSAAAMIEKIAPDATAVVHPSEPAMSGTSIAPTPPAMFPPVLSMPVAVCDCDPAIRMVAAQYVPSTNCTQPKLSDRSATLTNGSTVSVPALGASASGPTGAGAPSPYP